MIELERLSMSYAIGDEEVQVLRDLDLKVADGERVAILGPSGSGKTTLLLLLAGLERCQQGHIRLGGVALSDLDADALADLRRDRIGFIFQSFHLVPSLTALDNVALPLEIAGDTRARMLAARMLDQVGLAYRERHYPAQLSGGEQQRVAIARALVHGPRLILADEPTGNLDSRTGERVGHLLFDLNEGVGATLVLVTHDAGFARRCDRVLQLRDGRLVERAQEGRDAFSA
ncbi:ABC transporter ATP-binding protein [Marinobacterium aestuariivivens]|uniref:ABC transporter ATP-binding protein n=1 Tax=Marinobacterium aestuariivivens TaxID=1698799 RepID=A0ABW2A417_9GAMM